MTTSEELVKNLREMFPLIKTGPVTQRQREIIHEAADMIEDLMNALNKGYTVVRDSK